MSRISGRFPLICAVCAALCAAACSAPQTLQDASLQMPNLPIPAGGITPVREVIVTPRENDMLELTGAASGTFRFEQLQAVLWCRAARHAKENRYADWSPVKMEQLRAPTPELPMIGRGLVQLLKAAPAAGGRKPPAKDWCKDAPRVAIT